MTRDSTRMKQGAIRDNLPLQDSTSLLVAGPLSWLPRVFALPRAVKTSVCTTNFFVSILLKKKKNHQIIRPSPFFMHLQINIHSDYKQTIAVSTSGRVYEDFARLLFFHAHREASILSGELPQESAHFRFLRASRLVNLKTV